MNVSSLEISKKLYEVSGWGYLGEVEHSWQTPSGVETVILTKIQGAIDDGGFLRPWATPAYDLGYIIRKLPTHIKVEKIIDRYWAIWLSGKRAEHAFVYDNPEDALCKLAVELFNQNILTREVK